MTSLLIVGRELRGRARNPITYWSRFGAALVALLISVPEPALNGAAIATAASGQAIFSGIVMAALVVACGSCLVAADAISSERREGTLGLLFLAPVKVVDVLFGKLLSQGISSLCALLALLPALMIPVLLGGVTGGEVFRKSLALVCAQGFALAAGLWVSASQRTRVAALSRAVLWFAILAIGPFLLFIGRMGAGWELAGLPSPLVLTIAASETAYKASPSFYWMSVASVLGVTVCLLALAGWRLRRAVREETGDLAFRKPEPEPERRDALEVCRWEPDKETSGPVEWMVYRQHGVHGAVWALALGAFLLSRLASLAQHPGSVLGHGGRWMFSWPLGLGCGLLGGTMIAWIASRFFVQVRQTGELELLQVTPVGAETLVSDQWKVLQRVFLWPLIGIQGLILIPVLATASSMNNGLGADWSRGAGLALAFNVANTLLGASVLCRLGLWFGHQARGQASTLVRAVGWAVGFPWAINLAWAILAGTAVSTFAPPNRPVATGWLPEFAISVFYFWLLHRAKEGLRRDLTQAESATAPPAAPPAAFLPPRAGSEGVVT